MFNCLKTLCDGYCQSGNLLLIFIKRLSWGQTLSDNEFDDAMDRMLDASRCSTWSELAKFLEVQPSAIAQANSKKKAIPSNWLITLLRKRMVNPEWVLHGGAIAKYLQPRKQDNAEMLGDLIRMHAAIA